MNAEHLGMIFEVGLLPFVRDHFPDGHRLQQDNDPKHASGYIDDFCKENGINWWCTPPESPDLTIWGSLKQYLRNISSQTFGSTQGRITAVLAYFNT